MVAVNELTLRWKADGPSGEPELRVWVDGTDLVEMLRRVELVDATREGHPDIAGGYAGLVAWRLRGRLAGHFLGGDGSHLCCGPHEKTVLLGCDCGEPGCWPLMARVDVTGDEVRWSDFEQPHRRGRWSHDALGPLVFARDAYEQALVEAERTAPPPSR